MNIEPNKSHNEIKITFSGHLVIDGTTLRELLSGLLSGGQIHEVETPPPASAPAPRVAEEEKGLPRLAYTMRETAEILGTSYITVHRLLRRGLLRSSLATHSKMIPKTEIERFLKTTTEL